MNSIIKGSMIFAIGVSVGSAIGWAVAKQKFNKIIEDMVPEPGKTETEKKPDEEKPETTEKAASKAMKRYSPVEPPHAITPEEFDEESDEYERESLTYYEEDGVLMSPYGQDVTAKTEELIGEDFEDEFVDDVCYIRNSRLMIDYEVTREHCSSGFSGDAEGDDE